LRERRAPTKLTYATLEYFSPQYHSFLVKIHSYHKSKTYKEASKLPEWCDAMSLELATLDKIGTWELVPLPIDKVPITCKWIYKIKTRFDGSVERYKP
jgi:hypothetical protein